MDWGAHLIDQLLLLYNSPVTSIHCHMTNLAFDTCDDGFQLHLLFEGGQTASVYVGTAHSVSPPRWLVFGEKGSMTINDWESDGKLVVRPPVPVFDGKPPVFYGKAGPTITMAPQSAPEEEIIITEEPSYEGYYVNFADAMDGKCMPEVMMSQVYRVMQIIDAAYHSHKTGTAVLGSF